jgi:hypothetical protein
MDMDGRIACKKDLPPGPWTAEVIQMIVKARVAEIRAKLKTMQRSVASAQVVKAVAIPEKKETA